MDSALRRSREFGHEDYDAVERAVMETPRGRWFLAERDRRRISLEAQRVIDAISRLETSLAAFPQGAEPSRPTGAAIASAASAESAAQGLSMKSRKYFRDDDVLFKPAPVPAPVLASVAAAPAEPANKGARLIVRRISDSETTPAPESLPALSQGDKRRIVIIRRAAAEPAESAPPAGIPVWQPHPL